MFHEWKVTVLKMLFYANGKRSSSHWTQCNSNMFLTWGITLLECFCFPRCLTRRHGRMYRELRPPPLILSSLTNLGRWNCISNGKKEWYSSTWSSDDKIGFVEFNIVFNIPKEASFKECYQLSILPSVIMRKSTSCFVWFGCFSYSC